MARYNETCTPEDCVWHRQARDSRVTECIRRFIDRQPESVRFSDSSAGEETSFCFVKVRVGEDMIEFLLAENQLIGIPPKGCC